MELDQINLTSNRAQDQSCLCVPGHRWHVMMQDPAPVLLKMNIYYSFVKKS